MKNKTIFYFIVALLCMCAVIPTEASEIIADASYGGASFFSVRIGYETQLALMPSAPPTDVGADVYYFYQAIGTSAQKTYLVYPRVVLSSFESSLLVMRWHAGVGIARSYYDVGESNISIAPGLGVETRRGISSKLELNGRAVVLAYTDGLSLPCELFLEYGLNDRFAVRFGGGFLANLMWGSKAEVFLRGGVLLGASYRF